MVIPASPVIPDLIGNPGNDSREGRWIPAFAGMTGCAGLGWFRD